MNEEHPFVNRGRIDGQVSVVTFPMTSGFNTPHANEAVISQRGFRAEFADKLSALKEFIDGQTGNIPIFVRRAFACLIVSFVSAVTQLSASGEESSSPEYQIKAAFVLNFPKYVDWPPSAFAGTNSPIVIAVFGSNEVGAELEAACRGKIINGRQVMFKRVAAVDDSAGCNILFVGDSEKRNLPAIFEKLRNSSVLTVGESDDFIEKGGIINLTRHDQKISLEVNLIAAQLAGLRISSKLLRVAKVKLN